LLAGSRTPNEKSREAKEDRGRRERKGTHGALHLAVKPGHLCHIDNALQDVALIILQVAEPNSRDSREITKRTEKEEEEE